MKNKNKKDARALSLKLILQELNANPYAVFNRAFALMSVIPFLVFVYLFGTKLFPVDIFTGNVGLILAISLFISFCGYYISYQMIKNILTKIILYAAKSKYNDQLKSTIITSVSHEIKTPFTIIKWNLSNMLQGLMGKLNQQQKEMLETCQNVIDRAIKLVTNLITFHKTEAGMHITNRKKCDIGNILEKQLKEFQPAFNNKGIRINNEISNKRLSIWGDEDKLLQVTGNILSNASKYTPKDGEVTVKAFSTSNLVRLEFINSGPNIPDNKLEKIFDKFERVTDIKEGLDLGLSLAKDMVELHGGKIWAENQSPDGCKFIVVLPQDLRHKN